MYEWNLEFKRIKLETEVLRHASTTGTWCPQPSCMRLFGLFKSANDSDHFGLSPEPCNLCINPVGLKSFGNYSIEWNNVETPKISAIKNDLSLYQLCLLTLNQTKPAQLLPVCVFKQSMLAIIVQGNEGDTCNITVSNITQTPVLTV